MYVLHEIHKDGDIPFPLNLEAAEYVEYKTKIRLFYSHYFLTDKRSQAFKYKLQSCLLNFMILFINPLLNLGVYGVILSPNANESTLKILLRVRRRFNIKTEDIGQHQHVPYRAQTPSNINNKGHW
jgi:hypothetical protein